MVVESLYCILDSTLWKLELWPVLALMRASQLPVEPELQDFESFSTKLVDVVVLSVSSAAYA
jgi:hypothetical protein